MQNYTQPRKFQIFGLSSLVHGICMVCIPKDNVSILSILQQWNPYLSGNNGKQSTLYFAKDRVRGLSDDPPERPE